MLFFSFLEFDPPEKKRKKKALSTNTGGAVLVEGLARKWAEAPALDWV